MKEKPDEIRSNQSSFVTDVAIDLKNGEPDLLGFDSFATRIADEIKTVSSSESVVFGINGEWGEGKTSMINLIRKKLENVNYTVVDFHPWKTNSGVAVNQLFFDVLKDGLKKKILGINHKIDRYAEALLQLDNTGIGKTLWQLIFQSEPVEKQKEKLSESMKMLDKNLVVVVDDLDRLAKNEIADVLKLMRDTANFPNLVFLAAYDREYLNEAIRKEINEHNYENYMDKIVLWEAPIYKPQPRRYVSVLQYDYLEKKYPKYKTEIEILMNSKQLFDTEEYLAQSQNCFPNLREIKRFFNFFSFEFKVLENKGIDFHDFFCLSLLKFKSKNYYYQFKEAFHDVHKISAKTFQNDSTQSAKISIKQGEIPTFQIDHNSINDELDLYIKTIQMDDSKKYLERILTELIHSPIQDHPGSFSLYKNWPLYFYVGNNDDITLSEMAVMLNTPKFEDFKDYMIKYDEIIKKFEVSQILEIIYESQNSFLENCKRIIWLSKHIDSVAMYNRILDFLRKDEEKKENYSSLLINFIKEEEIENKSIKIIDKIINKRKKELTVNHNDQQEFCIDLKSAISYCRIEFIGLLGTTDRITLKLINLFRLCYQQIDESDITLDQDIVQKMRERVYKLPDEFLLFIVFDKLMLSPRNETEFCFNDSLLSIFKDKQEFIEFLSPDKYKTEKKRAKIFLKYAKENIKENLTCLSFNITDYSVRTDFFEDLLTYEDFFETQKWDKE